MQTLVSQTVGFSEDVQAIFQELVGLICGVVLFMYVMLSGILCFKLKSKCVCVGGRGVTFYGWMNAKFFSRGIFVSRCISLQPR